MIEEVNADKTNRPPVNLPSMALQVAKIQEFFRKERERKAANGK